MADTSTNGVPIAVLKVIDPDTGEGTLVYVRTCTEAVICPDGMTAQDHMAAFYGHISDDGIHLTVEQKAAMETKSGAQEKATTAKTEAVAAASLLVQAAKNEAASDATQKAEAARDAAYQNTAKTQAALDAHKQDSTNPHKVTAEQVGLGNVPNKSTNNLEPTYTAASILAKLSSGEKLSVAFGKIAKAITDLIAHIGNKSNPHGVTASQAGAVPKSGGTMTGSLTLDGGHLILKEGVNYGDTLPEPGVPGRIFFKKVDV